MKSVQGILLLAAALVLAGCSPQPAPTETAPADDPSASSSPSDEVSAPVVPSDCAEIEGAATFPADFVGQERAWDAATPSPGWPADVAVELQCSWFVSGSDTTGLTVQFGTSAADSASAVAALVAEGFTCAEDAQSGTTCERVALNPYFPTDTVVQLYERAGGWIAVSWSNSAVFTEDLIGELAAA